jgi:hypothetical protein
MMIPEDERNQMVADAMLSEGWQRLYAQKMVFAEFCANTRGMNEMRRYQSGPDGCCAWMSDNMCAKIIPKGSKVHQWVLLKDLPNDKDKYGRSFMGMWKRQQEVIQEALALDGSGNYKHNLICLVWPRGLGKSFLAIGLSLYRFFCFSYQKIYYSANSREEIATLHYNEAKTYILNSPKLVEIVGERNVQEGKIKIIVGAKTSMNEIKTLPITSGIVSNASVVTQSEVFKMEDDNFFAMWYGSLRGTPNALGIIDSTASDKEHWLYKKLYLGAKKNPNGKIYFNYFGFKNPEAKKFWHPDITTEELNSYKIVFTKYNFRRFFQNLWGIKKDGLFAESHLKAISYLGANGVPINHDVVVKQLETIKEKSKVLHVQRLQPNPNRRQELAEIARDQLMPVREYIDLGGYTEDKETTLRQPAYFPKLTDVKKITDLLNTDRFSLLVGIDRAQPNKVGTSGARTIVVWMAKIPAGAVFNGLIDDPFLYFMLGVAIVGNSMTSPIILLLDRIHREFSIDFISADSYLFGDISTWCDVQHIPWQSKTATLPVQAQGFGALITAIHNGLFKAPPIPVGGSSSGDILREELRTFDELGQHKQSGVKRYGSPTKDKPGGVQDDCIDAIGTAIFGGLGITTDSMGNKFESARNNIKFMPMVPGYPLIQSRYGGLYS